MKILVVGGGSGGHVTPAVAVVKELIKLDKKAQIRFWCDRGFADRARPMVKGIGYGIRFQTVISGKLRRYNHLSVLGHLKLPKTMLLNLGDMFLVGVGFIQSVIRLIIWRPQVIFAKGGFVCLPVGLAARVLRIPLVIHDSDAHPGLTNRILSRWAKRIATGAPLDNYNYPLDKTTYVGIPINEEFKPFSPGRQSAAKRALGLDPKKPLVLVTGGGLGAKRINDAIVKVADDLLKLSQVLLITGRDQYYEVRLNLGKKSKPGLRVESFVSTGVIEMLGAADLVITRAGATSLLELAALGKPMILVPNAQLTGGHQLKNAEVYAKKSAAVIINEDEMVDSPDIIVDGVRTLLNSPDKMEAMSRAVLEFAKPKAAQDMARIVYEAI